MFWRRFIPIFCAVVLSSQSKAADIVLPNLVTQDTAAAYSMGDLKFSVVTGPEYDEWIPVPARQGGSGCWEQQVLAFVTGTDPGAGVSVPQNSIVNLYTKAVLGYLDGGVKCSVCLQKI